MKKTDDAKAGRFAKKQIQRNRVCLCSQRCRHQVTDSKDRQDYNLNHQHRTFTTSDQHQTYQLYRSALWGHQWELYQRQRTGFGQKQWSYHQGKNTVKETKQDRLEVNALATGNSNKYQSLTNTEWETNCLSQTLFARGG
jgi:hypothetical protein